jgi:hypothetical protein
MVLVDFRMMVLAVVLRRNSLVAAVEAALLVGHRSFLGCTS